MSTMNEIVNAATPTALAGQVALVTGGGRGIGGSISRQLAAMGATTVICGRHQRILDETAQAITASGGKCYPVTCDVTYLSSVEVLCNHLEQTFGRLDILVNNVGVGGPRIDNGPLHEMSPDVWDLVYKTCLRSVYYCIRTFAPMMIRAKRGHIINISNIDSKKALPNRAASTAVKFAMNGLSYSVAEELRDYNIRVSVVIPGSTVAPNSNVSKVMPYTDEDFGKVLFGSDVARVIAMLVTQAPQSFVSEVVVRPIYGGQRMAKDVIVR